MQLNQYTDPDLYTATLGEVYEYEIHRSTDGSPTGAIFKFEYGTYVDSNE